jgi:tetratricopeptide (TPR) repeat protein
MLVAASAQAQIPDTFTNLKVLPKDIKKSELVNVMRGFAGDLGVRCAHCHEARDPEDLSTFSWASDKKPEKDIARAMMSLSKAANEDLDKALGEKRPDHLKIKCFTCHHGNARPETLADALLPLLKNEGPDAAVAHYRDLRKEYYGQAAYDFSEWSLVSVAEEMSHDPAQIKSTLALLNLNLEFYPESAPTHARIAESYIAAGDTVTAMTHYDKALTLAPEDPRLKKRVDMIKSIKK